MSTNFTDEEVNGWATANASFPYGSNKPLPFRQLTGYGNGTTRVRQMIKG